MILTYDTHPEKEATFSKALTTPVLFWLGLLLPMLGSVRVTEVIAPDSARLS